MFALAIDLNNNEIKSRPVNINWENNYEINLDTFWLFFAKTQVSVRIFNTNLCETSSFSKKKKIRLHGYLWRTSDY